MSGLASSIGGLFGGSSAKTDRKFQLAGMGGLQNIFNFAIPSGEAETGAAQQTLGNASQYYNKLLGGDRATTLQAVAPTVNAATSQTDAMKRAISQSGTARGGGVNATTQSLEDQKRASIDSAINQAKSGAAAGATSVGGTMASQAGNLLGTGESAAGNLADIASKSRVTSNQLHNQAVQQTGSLIDAGLDLAFGI